jgi:hypothetical protein
MHAFLARPFQDFAFGAQHRASHLQHFREMMRLRIP